MLLPTLWTEMGAPASPGTRQRILVAIRRAASTPQQLQGRGCTGEGVLVVALVQPLL